MLDAARPPHDGGARDGRTAVAGRADCALHGRRVRAYGAGALAQAESGGEIELAPGQVLLRLVFAGESALPGALETLTHGKADRAALTALKARFYHALEDNPELLAEAAITLAGYCRREFGAGNIKAMARLGDLLRWDDPEQAQLAYHRAIDAGDLHALIDLARHLFRDLGGDNGALAVYQRAIDAGDTEVTWKPWST